MEKQITVIYSPLCRAHENIHYFQKALEQGYGLQEISVLDLDQYWDQLDARLQDCLTKMKNEGGFLAAPLAFFDGQAIPVWKLETVLKEAHLS